MPKLASIFSLFLAVTASLVLTLVSSSPRSAELAAVFPPWWNAAQVFAAAGAAGDIVGTGLFPFIVVVHGMSSDLAVRLRRSGAIVTLDARAFAACGTPNLEPAQ